MAQRELGYTLALLEARGELDPDSPQAEAFIRDFIRWVTMHEVGHTLGLRHNFRGSIVHTPPQLADATYTQSAGLLGSVMDYPPANIALAGVITTGKAPLATAGTFTFVISQDGLSYTITFNGTSVSDSAGTLVYTRTGKKTGRINFIDAVNGAGVINLTFTSITTMTYTMTRGTGTQAGTMSVQ